MTGEQSHGPPLSPRSTPTLRQAQPAAPSAMALPVPLQHPHHQQPPAESVAVATARLHRLARRGDVAGVEAILGRHPRLLYAHDAHGKTPLMLAAYKGQLALVKALLRGHERRRDPASGGSEVCAQCTAIHAPPPPDPKPSTSPTTSTSCCCLLRKSEALLLAAWFGHPKVCATLLAYGADPNYRNSWGVTPLMIAAEIPFPDVVLTLLHHPTTDINARALADGRTALATAVAQGNAEAAQLLLLHGADPTLRDREGKDVFGLLEGQKQGACAFLLGEWERRYMIGKGRLLVEGGRAAMAVAVGGDGDREKAGGDGSSMIPCSEAVGSGGGSKRQKRHHHHDHHHHHSAVAVVAAGAVHVLCEDTFRELMALMGRTAAGPDVLLRFPPEVGDGEGGCDGVEGDGLEALVLLSDDEEEEEQGADGGVGEA